MSDRMSVVSRAEAGAHSPYGRYIFISFVILVLQITVLLLLDRQWFCACGSVRLWQGALDPAQNSQQLTDPYSFLHLAFGCGLFLWLKAIRPQWHLARRATYALASSVLWEIFENLPFIIQIFGTEGSGLRYSGDSIANSFADTVIAILGFLVASRLRTGWTVSAMIGLELATFLLIGDSVVAGMLRIIVSATTI
ncbi:DUF2585 family protein [Rhizobium deserti]|uniref:DUF2585 family protein n=1 Tax=Rhizobium deserti TaxID=2547961 RepID=A0A4R5UGI2_9HYPH|nr:DUF2585 family protein [Rhizobium deserti]TDK35024.1 DUF2585 family protein [Rhizobium deserti]